MESPKPCTACAAIVDGSTTKKHSELVRGELHQPTGMHGSTDHEYRYRCSRCGETFTGDSGGVWKDSKRD